MKSWIVFPCLAALLPASSPDLLACRCVPLPAPGEELQRVDVVFRGTLLAFDRMDSTGRRGVFLVQTIWKGPIRPDFHVGTGVGGADCGFPFVPGEKYIIYAFGSVEDMNTHTCTRTGLDDGEEAAALGPPIWEAPGASGFRRSDPDEDGSATIGDAVRVLNFLFLGGFPPLCLDAADSNDNGEVNIADAIYHLHHIFFGSAAPPAPYLDCGTDPTADGLGCERHSSCG